MREAERFDEILHRLEQAVAETRSLAGTIGLAPELDPAFVATWAGHLRHAGEAVRGADSGAVAEVRGDLAAFARELDPPSDAWPVYGALIVNLRNIVAALDRVAEAQPVAVPTPTLAR
jgi:hypothetical protein